VSSAYANNGPTSEGFGDALMPGSKILPVGRNIHMFRWDVKSRLTSRKGAKGGKRGGEGDLSGLTPPRRGLRREGRKEGEFF
jgi:hypothetical protein